MFGFLKKKQPMTPAEDLSAVMNTIFDRLKAADRKTGIEQTMAINITFGATIPIIREHFPNVPIEDDGPAMTALSMGHKEPNWQKIDDDIAYMLQQVRSCPKDREMRNILIRSFLSPDYVVKTMARAEARP